MRSSGRSAADGWEAGVLVARRAAAVSTLLLAAACWSSSASFRVGADDAGFPPDAEEAGEADDGGEIQDELADVAADTPDASEVPCGPNACPLDPDDWPLGAPCIESTDCPPGFECARPGEAYESYCSGGIIDPAGMRGICVSYGAGAAGCDVHDPLSCPAGSRCVHLEAERTTGRETTGCLPSCSAVSPRGIPWTRNCGCPAAFACRLGTETCALGCCKDSQCCEIWHDGEGAPRDGVRQAEEVAILPPERCADTCNPCTFACDRRGCLDGECAIGDPCEHDSDCPPLGRCVGEWETAGRFAGGMCVQDDCTLVGRDCPMGSGCADLGGLTGPWNTCVVPCAATTAPGDAGFPCRDVDPPGPSIGDYACHPMPPDHWLDGLRTDDGYCWPGNFTGGGPPWAPCADDAECPSPFGLGMCLGLGDAARFCTVACNQAVALAGACGGADPDTGLATGVCAAQFCVQACDPAATPTGCTGAATACYPIEVFGPGTYSFVAEGATMPAGVCWPRCVGSAWCEDVWLAGSCDPATGTCLF